MTHQNKGKGKHKVTVGITLGDPNGIGPEVVIKALSDNRILSYVTPVLYGSTRTLSFYKKLLNLNDFNYIQVKNPGQFSSKGVNVINSWADDIEVNPGKPTPETGKAAFQAIEQACQDIKNGIIDTLVTGPIDKSSIQHDNFPFKGHTDFLAHFFDSPDYTMCMVSDEMNIALVTEHIPLKEVAEKLSKELITTKVKTFEKFLQKAMGITKPKLAMLALNPHAGEGGLLGKEEEEIIIPVIQELKNKGRLIYGPFPADGFFGSLSYKKYDGVLALYHDQGLIPAKLLAFHNTVNITAGLPIVRTAPDHGTAYSLAGKNSANPDSMREAIFRSVSIYKNMFEHELVEKN